MNAAGSEIGYITPVSTTAMGIVFSVGQSTLSSYNTGTFTPTITFDTPGDLSVAYTTQLGTYTIVGRMIVATVTVSFTPTYTTASSFLQVQGFPVTFSGFIQYGTAFTSVINIGSFTYVGCTTRGSSAAISIYGGGSNIGSNYLTTGNYPSGTAYSIQATITAVY